MGKKAFCARIKIFAEIARTFIIVFQMKTGLPGLSWSMGSTRQLGLWPNQFRFSNLGSSVSICG
jgi:hypothetical protein